MSFSLSQWSNGDTNYVSTFNGNMTTIASVLNGILAILAGSSGGGGVATLAIYQALFGETVAVVGADSYECTGSGVTLTVAAGFVWSPATSKLLAQVAPSTLDFTSVAAGTYYITADPTGAPVRNATLVADSICSVVWTGSAFGTITLLANIVWGAADDIAAQASAALGASFESLDDRLEAGETLAVQGGKAYNGIFATTSLSVAGGVDVALTAAQADSAVLNFTGAITADINITIVLATAPKMWLVTNNTTGAHTLTVKGSAGTGISVPNGGGVVVLYSDGTNILQVINTAGIGTVSSVGLSLPADFSVSGSPVTGSGVLAATWVAKAANLVFAGPGSGGSATPGFRVLVAADIPGLAYIPSSYLDTDGTLAANSDTKVASQKATKTYADTVVASNLAAAKTYADGLVVGLWDDRGSYNASGNVFPSSGGSGTAGAILKGDIWTISVAGTLGGTAVAVGDLVRALVDTPGSTAGNWALTEHDLGYTAENASNKDASGGYPGLTLLKLNLRNAANTITSWFTTAATVARTWTMPDKDGTVAMLSDITGTNTGTNTGDETATSIATIDHGVSTKSTPVDADELNLLDSAASFALKRFTFTNLKAFLKTYFDTLYGSGSGSVTTVSVTTANGVSGSVATATTTPAITLTLGAITPTTVNGVTVSGSSTPTLAVTGTTTVSGANTGNETGASIATLHHAASAKTTLVDADETTGGDSAASFGLIRTTWANVKVFLKAYNDTLYAALVQPFDVHAFYPGIPTASAKVIRVPIARAVTFAANFSGSYFKASANAAATTVFDVQQNGSSIGSISIASGGTTATFTTTSGTAKNFVAGDVLMIVCPATPDTTLADPGFVLVGTR